MPQASRKYGNILSPFHRFDKFILHPKFELFNTQYSAKGRITPAFLRRNRRLPFPIAIIGYYLSIINLQILRFGIII